MSLSIQNSFPVGYYPFHENESFNFQLNRFHSLGGFGYDELMEIGKKIDGFETWISLFTKIAEEAEKNGDYLKAATSYRAAQFYTVSGEKDKEGHSLKHLLYEKCRKLYDQYFSQYPEIQYTHVPFINCQLPVYYARCDKPLGTIVIHGGYDSIAQEFLILIPYFHALNYDVYFFEGPGQGEVLMRYDVRMTPEWEHCTKAILDHFDLDDVTLIGISLGGYLAPRAAAYDDRIRRVVMFDLIYDFYGAILHKMGKWAGFFDFLTRHPKNIFWKWMDKKLYENYFTNWLMKQGYAIYENVHTPCEYFNYIRQFNTREISPMLTQDVLVLAGQADLYTIYYEEQLKALTKAASVTGRLFTREENADHHCQIGNVGLLLKVVTEWIQEKTDGKKTGTDRRKAG